MKKLLFIISIIACTTTAIGNFNKQVSDEAYYRWECVYWAIAAVESNFNHSAVGSNVEAMTSKGLRNKCLSKYTELGASYNVGLTTEPLLVIACVITRFFYLLK